MKKIPSFLFLLLSVCLVLFSCSSDEDFLEDVSSFGDVSSGFLIFESSAFTESETENTVSSPTDKSGYILNKSTRIFHYPSCFCVERMSEKNKKFFEGSREDVLFLGYDSCGHCHP